MNIAYSKYRLTNLGALLRFTFEDGTTGYADCHPWPELGDVPLDDQLQSLKQGNPSPQMECSLYFAKLDAEARKQGRSLFERKQIPPSHYLLTEMCELDAIWDQGFTRIKVKVGRNPNQEAEKLREILSRRIPDGCKVRLDFNNRLNQSQFEEWISVIQSFTHMIDFIEDPFPFDPTAWQQIQETYGVGLACDRVPEKALQYPDAYAVVIWKPAIQPCPNIPEGKRLIITSYMDHPLGQMAAAYAAAPFSQGEVMGLLSHKIYQTTPFSEALYTKGPYLHPDETTTGLGFDPLLTKLKWEKL